MTEEIWKPVAHPVHCKNYEVSSLGNVRRNGRVLKAQKKGCGHLQVFLSVNSCVSKRLVHRLVLEAFVGPCPPKHECRHLDSNPANNRLENLKWGTRSENAQDRPLSVRLRPRGTGNGRAKINEDTVRAIRAARRDNIMPRKIATAFAMPVSTVQGILSGQRWAWVQ